MTIRFRVLAILIILLLILCGCYSPPPTPDPTALPTTSGEVIPTASSTPEPTQTAIPQPTATAVPTSTATATAEPHVIDPALQAWLQQSAIPFETTEPGSGFDDLQALKPIIGDARIVALGEATHGTHEFFQMKHRLFEFMVEEMGFNTFAIEASFAESNLVDAYVQGGDGDAEALAEGMGFWTWDTREVADLIEWMRAYNQGKDAASRIHFRGFDMQFTPQAYRDVTAYIRLVDPDAVSEVQPDLNCATLINAQYTSRPEADRAACRSRLQVVYAWLNDHQTEYIANSSTEAFAFALQSVQVILQAEAMYSEPHILSRILVRDQAMAQNVAWLLEQAGENGRMVLWAHNGHVSSQLDGGTMGDHLRQQFGDDLLTVGFAFNQGRFDAFPINSFDSLVEYSAPPAPSESAEYVLHGAGLPRYFLDLRDAGENPAAAEWLTTPQPIRLIGALYDDRCPQGFFRMMILQQAYDVLIYFEDTSGAEALSLNVATANLTHTDFELSPFNLGFEDSNRCWSSKDTGVLSITKDEAHSGDNSARLVSFKADVESGFGQGFSPLGMLGKRVRISAYVKTSEVTGRAAIFAATYTGYHMHGYWNTYDSQPLSGDNEWTQIEIVFDVPANTSSIEFGVQLEGSGKVWADDFVVEIVGTDVPVSPPSTPTP